MKSYFIIDYIYISITNVFTVLVNMSKAFWIRDSSTDPISKSLLSIQNAVDTVLCTALTITLYIFSSNN